MATASTHCYSLGPPRYSLDPLLMVDCLLYYSLNPPCYSQDPIC